MTPEHERRLRSPSPPGSGRDSPLPGQRGPRRQLEDEPSKQEKPYRRWTSQIERALSHFDTARLEWPDYISGLGRLLKVIQAHPPDVNSVPQKQSVASKLAQCLNPSLPSGVHQKALELYDFIFVLLGRSGLARDLSVFLPGLSPVLSFASLSIRPAFLSLLERHIVTLDASALRPALRALLLCLLPGLEEENSEDFDRTLKIADDIRFAVNDSPSKEGKSAQGFGDEYFWQCLFLSTISGNSRRQGALAFLVRRLPKLGPSKIPAAAAQTNGDSANSASGDGEAELPQAAEAVVSPEPGLLIRCFAAGLEDEQPLVQRGYLDLLLTHLPLHSPMLTSRVGDQDRERIVSAASTVLARRDMSLNRRLWSWFLGPNNGDDDDSTMSPTTPIIVERRTNTSVAYFRAYGLQPLSASILRMLQQPEVSLGDLVRSYRIALSLSDRWEIGNAVVASIFVPAFQALLEYRASATPNDYQEALRSASSFFDGIEAGLIWSQILTLISSALGNKTGTLETGTRKLELACFIVQSFNVRDEEMLAFHIPLCCVYTLACVVERARSDNNSSSVNENTTDSAVFFAGQLVERMPERAQLNTSFGQDSGKEMSQGRLEQEIITSISKFYAESDGDMSCSPPPLSSHQIVAVLLQSCSNIFIQALQTSRSTPTIAARSKLLSSLITKTPDCHALDAETFVEHCKQALLTDRKLTEDFVLANSIAKSIVTMLGKASAAQRRAVRSSGIASILVHKLWTFLSPVMPKFHVETVRTLWQLDSADSTESVLESSVSQFVSKDKSVISGTAESARRFAVLWTHSMNISAGAQKRGSVARRSSLTTLSTTNFETRDHQSILIRPLLLALEGLSADGSEVYFFLVGWLKSSGILFTVSDVLIFKLAALASHQQRRLSRHANPEQHRTMLTHGDQTQECCYYLRHVSNLFRLPLDNIGMVLSAQGTSLANAGEESDESLQANAIKLCLDIAQLGFEEPVDQRASSSSEMQCQALGILQQLFSHIEQPGVDFKSLEHRLLDMLTKCTQTQETASSVQVAVLDTIMSYLKLRYMQSPKRSIHHRNSSSVDAISLSNTRRSSVDRGEEKPPNGTRIPPPEQLLKRLQDGITSQYARNVLENWVLFMIEILPLYAHTLFQNLIPLVETFCKQININFRHVKKSFAVGGGADGVMPESSLMSLLNGLENALAVAHDRLAFEENANAVTRPQEPTQGFFGNVVSGVFSSETPKTRQSSANSRLTVILCLQDAVRICFGIWSWAAYGQEEEQFDPSSSASFYYTSSRLRNRARRLLDRMFVAETLECFETLVALKGKSKGPNPDRSIWPKAISLLQSLDGSRPQRLMPAIFNSLYSRTNPNALEPGRMSTLTSEVKDTDLGVFLIDYTRSLDDDAMDEIWIDCMTFLKDVLSNPFVHSSILPCLLLFLLTLAEKVEKTNFGEQRKMRKELSDLFQRLLQATFTSRPAGILHDPGDGTGTAQGLSVIEILATVIPKLNIILPENDKQLSAVTLISNSVFGTLIHAKQFPDNVSQSHLTLLQRVVRISPAAKIWRKDVAEVYGHPKLFSLQKKIVQAGLLPVLRHWGINDKERIPDTLHRIPAPTSAGIVFGVGANTARLEADKKTQLNLRRSALLALALDIDALVPYMATILEKINELLSASATSSPSSATRAEVFMLLQAVVLKTSSVHLSPLWPAITAELQKAISSATQDGKDHETYNAFSLLQACKLLDLLLLLGPDDFQMHAWLFVTDTIDAVYRPTGPDSAPVGLVDEIAEDLSHDAPQTPATATATPVTTEPGHAAFDGSSNGQSSRNGLLLRATSVDVEGMSRDEMVRKVLKPWFAQLSLQCFEREYSMRKIDWGGCKQGVLDELFEEGTMVG